MQKTLFDYLQLMIFQTAYGMGMTLFKLGCKNNNWAIFLHFPLILKPCKAG